LSGVAGASQGKTHFEPNSMSLGGTEMICSGCCRLGRAGWSGAASEW
jgi:hypothetical protein